MQHAVDAEPDAQVVLGGSTWMSDARSPTAWVTSRLTNLTIGASSTTSETLARSALVVGVLGRGLHDRVDVAVHPVEALDRLVDLRRGRDDRAHLGAGDGADVVDREHVRRVGHRDDEPAVLPTDRDRLVAARERLGDERRDRAVDRRGR